MKSIVATHHHNTDDVCFIAAVGLIGDAADLLSSDYSIDQQQIATDVQIMNNSG